MSAPCSALIAETARFAFAAPIRGGLRGSRADQLVPIEFNPNTPEVWKVLREKLSAAHRYDEPQRSGRARGADHPRARCRSPRRSSEYFFHLAKGIGFRSQLTVPLLRGESG